MNAFTAYLENRIQTLKAESNSQLFISGALDELEQLRSVLAQDPNFELEAYLTKSIKKIQYYQEQGQVSAYGEGALTELTNLLNVLNSLN